jgi:hypothetical protein
MGALKARVSTGSVTGRFASCRRGNEDCLREADPICGDREHQIGSANHYDIAKGNRLGHAVGCSDRQRLKSKASAIQHLTAKVKES